MTRQLDIHPSVITSAGPREAFSRMTTGKAVTDVMDAAVLSAPGTPRFATFPTPQPADGHVLVDVRVAGLNPVDIAIASGAFAANIPPFPSVAGHEGVGTAAGRRVYFTGPTAPFGAMAQRTLISTERVVDLPDAVDDGTATALGTSGLAAWLALSWRGRLQPGETVLVLGATGALGSIAVQAARILGAGRVVAAGRDRAGLLRAADRGADVIVDITAGADLTSAFRNAAPGGIDLVIDPVWGAPALAALAACGPWARLIQIGNAAGAAAPVPAALLRRGSAAILGHTNLMVPPGDRTAAYCTMLGHAAAGRLVADVEHVPLRDVGRAWHRQAAFAHRKLVLVP